MALTALFVVHSDLAEFWSPVATGPLWRASKPGPEHGPHCLMCAQPLSSEYGTNKAIRVIFWPWLSGASCLNLLRCSLFARKTLRSLGPCSRLKMGSPPTVLSVILTVLCVTLTVSFLVRTVLFCLICDSDCLIWP